MFDKIPGQKPFIVNPLALPNTQLQKPLSPLIRYSLAILLPFLFLGLVMSSPIFVTGYFLPFFMVVGVVAWYCGVVPAFISVILSTLLVNFFLQEPVYQISFGLTDWIRLATFLLLTLLINIPNVRRRQAEEIIRQQREWFAVTLGSIGDAVIATDNEQKVTFINPVASELCGWTQAEALGKPITEVFRIVNEDTRKPVENPVEKVLREGKIVGLANHTILVSQDGGETPIDDSGAPIRNVSGDLIGAVLVFRDIGERKQAEAQLRESEARFRTMADTAPVMIWMSGTDKLCDYFNKVWLDYTGRTLEQELGNGWVEGIHPDDRERCLDTYYISFDARQTLQMEYRLRRADGEYRWMADKSIPRYTLDGTFLGYIGSCIDIHDFKLAQEAQDRLNSLLEQEQRRLSSILATVPGVVWEAWGEPDATTQRMDFVSEYVEQMLGYTVADWLNTPNFWLTIVHPDDKEQAATTSRATFTSQEKGVNRFRWVAKDGRVIPVETQSMAIFDEQGRPIGMRGVTMDVSQREQAERERLLLIHAQQVAIRQKEEAYALLDALFSSAPVGLALFDKNVRFQRLNQALADINGLPVEDHIGKTPRELLPDVASEGTEGMFLRVLETGKAVTFETSGRTLIPSDDTRYWLASYYPIRLGDELLGIGAVVLDITERKRIEKQRTELLKREREARKAAQEADRLKLTFLAMISHELRTPLTSIKGFATTLLADDITWDAESQRDFIAIISEESDKLTDLIEQLLDLSRLEAGTLGIAPESMAMAEIVSVAMAQLETISASHSLRIDVLQDLPYVLADLQRTGQIIVNLVNNAAKYSPPETEIRISAQQDDGFIQINVIDQGPGIPPEERSDVFEAFRQIKDQGANYKKGAGLGLAICKGLVEAHGGKIWIQDTTEGTTISFTLPIAEE
jgi:PAS domain S-box-containing protein